MNEPTRPGGPPPALLRTLRRLLRPLVRLAMRLGMTYPAFGELLKAVFVEVAERDFALPGKKQSDSRIHLLTGIHRRDVKRLRNLPPEALQVPRNVSLGDQAISRWYREPEYLDEAGRPRPLPRFRQADGSPSFESLVQSISKDIRPRPLLDEWLRLGVVELDADNRVRLRTEGFVPSEGLEEKLYYVGLNVHDHLAACDNNLTPGQPPLLERSAHYEGLTAADAEALHALARELGMRCLRALDAEASRRQAAAAGRPDANRRVNLGVYFYQAKAETESETERGAETADGAAGGAEAAQATEAPAARPPRSGSGTATPKPCT